MKAFVVDTNVPIAANAIDTHASLDCSAKCIQILEEVQSGLIVLDRNGRIIKEYADHLNPSSAQQQRPGARFYVWVMTNRYNPSRCELVSLTLRNQPQNSGAQTPDEDDFAEFPDDPALEGFDPSDRKFVAVALASANQPEVLNATDSDWWHYRKALAANGVTIRFLCPEAMPKRASRRAR